MTTAVAAPAPEMASVTGLQQILWQTHLTPETLAKRAGISEWSVRAALNGFEIPVADVEAMMLALQSYGRVSTVVTP